MPSRTKIWVTSANHGAFIRMATAASAYQMFVLELKGDSSMHRVLDRNMVG